MQQQSNETKGAEHDLERQASARQYEAWKTRYCDGQRADKFESRYYRGPRGYIKSLLNKLLLRRAFRHLDPGRTVLEVPCGSGRFISALTAPERRIIALDISESMIQRLRVRHSEGEPNRGGALCAIRGDVERLPLRGGSCSSVVSLRLMQAVDSRCRVAILREMRRICDGPLFVQYLSTFAFKHFSRWLRGKRQRGNRIDSNTLDIEAERAGLSVHRIFRKFWLFSEEVLVVFLPKSPES